MRKLLDRLSVDAINAFFRANQRGMIVSATPVDAQSVNGVFTVTHDLGEKPLDFFAVPAAALTVYATPANRAAWTATSATLTGTAAGAVRLYFIKRA